MEESFSFQESLDLAIKQIPEVRNGGEYLLNMVDLIMTLGYSIMLMMSVWMVYRLFMHFFADDNRRARVLSIVLCPMYYIGAISYELYLTHGYVLPYIDLTKVYSFMIVVTVFAAAIFMYLVVRIAQKYMRRLLIHESGS